MRFPVKLNQTYWPQVFTKIFPSATDPRVLCNGKVNETIFTRAVSTLRFGNVFKSTQKSRFPLTILEMASLEYEKKPVIVDIGASDGSTSLDVIQAMPFETYYVTDLNIEVFYDIQGDVTWFYDEKGNCILMVTDPWVIYPETGGGIFPFNRISSSVFARAPKWQGDFACIKLINPVVRARADTSVLVEKYNILEAWPHGKADLIIAANILNRGYFTTSEIKQALKNMVDALGGSGRIAIIDNRPNEKATIFRLADGNISVEKRINKGTEIEALVLNSLEINGVQTSANKRIEQV